MKHNKYIVVAMTTYVEIVNGKVITRMDEPIAYEGPFRSSRDSAQTILADIADASIDCRKDDGEGRCFSCLYEETNHCWFTYHTKKGVCEEHFFLVVIGREA